MRRLFYDQSTEDLLEILSKSLKELYPNDGLSPGVIISFLPTDEWYVSANRYFKNGSKCTVVKGIEKQDIKSAIITCIKNLQNLQAGPPYRYKTMLMELE